MKRTIALSLCLAFVASVVFAFPPGMPPKENPLVTKVAPEEKDLGLFFSWQGIAPADSSSTNKVEQVLAKPEVKNELAKMQASFIKLFSGSDNNVVSEKIVELALKNGACVYGESKESFCSMISLDADSVALVDKIIAEMKKAAAAGEINVANIKVGSIPFYKVTDSSEEDFYWGVLGKGRVLVFSSNLKGLTTILTNARTPEPNWVASAKKDFALERLSTLSAFSESFIKEASQTGASTDETDPATDEFQKKFLGGDYVDKVVGASGLDSVGAVHKTAVYMKDGWKKTLPGVMINKPLAEKDLSAIPANAVVAIAGKTDLNEVFKAVSSAEGLSDEMKMQIAMGSMVVTPYLASLGDSWAFFMTQEDGVSGGALVWSLKNPAMAKIQLKQLMEMLKKNMKTEMQIEEFGLNNQNMNVIPTQLKLFGDDEDEDEDDNGPMPGIQIQVMPGGQIPPGAIPGGQIPNGAVPMGRGQIQLGGGVDPTMLLGLLPQSIEKIKIDSYDFWLLKNGDDESSNIVIGIVGKNLVVTTKAYAEKYVKFDGSKNLSSNKTVAKMMANNPSYLIYSDPKYIVGLLQTFGNQLDESMTDIALSTNLPIVVGVYSTDNAVRIDSNSGLPLPDMLLSSVGLFAFGSEESN